MALRKPTEIYRATLTQEARVILPAEDAPPHAVRSVQIIVPDEPDVLIGFGPQITPESIGPNRAYKLAELASDAQISFKLSAEQTILGVSAGPGLAHCTLIIEYLDD